MDLPEDLDSGSMNIHAQHIWSMLDDMANNDPASYRKFIDKQMKEGKEYMAPPKPHMCIQTKILNPAPEIDLFINVMEWHRIPAPKSDEAPIPVIGGPVYDGKDEYGLNKVVSVAFNKSVLDDFGIESTLVEERKLLVNLAIDYLEDMHKFKLSRNYTILAKDKKLKGKLINAQKSLTIKVDKDEKFEQELDELEKNFGPLASGCKDSLLNQLSNITVDQDAEPTFSSEINGKSSQPEIKLPGGAKPKKTGLIQEVSKEDKVLEKPEYELQTKDMENSKILVLRIKLPNVKSVSECELDISQDDIYLCVEEKYELKLSFQEKINDSDAHAKFSKKSSILTVSLPII